MNEDVKILIVDDEPRNLDALEVMLAPSGCTLVRAQSADEALLAMLRHEFAAMILDIRMPEHGRHRARQPGQAAPAHAGRADHLS